MMTLCLQKLALLKCTSFTTYKEISVHSFFIFEKAEWKAPKKYTELFSIFDSSKKLQPLVVENF